MKNIGIGIDDFKKIIDYNYYYVDKTELIKDFMDDEVALITRPSRFGRTLNLSMLYYFFSNKETDHAYLFNGLKISNYPDIMKHQNQYPVIYLSLKDVNAGSFEKAIYRLAQEIKHIVINYNELFDSIHIDDMHKKSLRRLKGVEVTPFDLSLSLELLTFCLEKHYNQKVIILIDELDTPLKAAYEHNYYDEMKHFIERLFSSALKTNLSLYKGMLIGCIKFTSEGILPDFNNYHLHSITDISNNEHFGFTDNEIMDMLEYYGLSHKKDEIKDWYGGYVYGETELYNPWSTLRYIDSLINNPSAMPVSFLSLFSQNKIVDDYIKNSDMEIKRELEILMTGGDIEKTIGQNLFFRDINKPFHIYNFLLFYGYLGIKEYLGNNKYRLVIPNKEVRQIYNDHFINYFKKFINDRKQTLYDCLIEGNTDKANDILNDILLNSISYYDNYESFYHGFLIGLFSGYNVESNREAGKGRFDITIYPNTIRDTVLVIECKHSASDEYLIRDAKNAVKQIIDKQYTNEPRISKYANSMAYGISFYKKECIIEKV